jgi:hypothetical protein
VNFGYERADSERHKLVKPNTVRIEPVEAKQLNNKRVIW